VMSTKRHDFMTIGSRLRAERKRLGMSQTDFAKVGGVGKNTQVIYEKDAGNPDTGYLSAIAAVGVDVIFVLTGRYIQEGTPALSHVEQEILCNIRDLEDIERETVRRMLHGLVVTADKKTKDD
ncbi:helix-turn-helix domain-containing protein, partial [Pseudomonas asuensis]